MISRSQDDAADANAADANAADANAADANPASADAGTNLNAECDGATIQFVLDGVPTSANRDCPAGCEGMGWLSVAPADGGDALDLATPCGTSCTTCGAPDPCPSIPCIAPTPLGNAGVSFTWNGTTTQGGECGTPSRSCQRSACTAPGNYVATMCASAASNEASTLTCSPAAARMCVAVPFVWPPMPSCAASRASTAADDVRYERGNADARRTK